MAQPSQLRTAIQAPPSEAQLYEFNYRRNCLTPADSAHFYSSP